MSAFADKQIKCLECNKDFTYTAAEQELHKSLGYQNEPKRCNPCREAKRQRRPGGREGRPPGEARPAAPEGAPRDAAPRPPQSLPQSPPRPPQQQQQQQRGRDGRRDGNRDNRGGGPRPPRDNRGGDRGGDRAERAAERAIAQDPGFMPREFFLAICAECGKEAQLPFKPAGDRPVYCIDCFAQKRTG
jgi:CxxC-x17-CxxC domain-containing protein